ncbi:glycosyltransferase family 2 protein [Flavobacterium sp.]|uniref:glycosyltransferase family 2 protein n=1 Tax=Flavobacterium sp. TaxID=239 RepID=UPI003D0C48B1
MEVLLLLTYLLLIGYILNILWLCIGFSKVKNFRRKKTTPKTSFSIIVPFRNEAKNLPLLLDSLQKIDYPKELFEIILVDDASEDNYESQIENNDFVLIKNNRKTNSPKKDAIQTAISQAKKEWILTTDADCVVPKNWLKTFDAYIHEHSVKMVASGVMYEEQTTVLHTFQNLDLLSLQGTTMGSFGNGQAFMCNGANFCYQKKFFKKLNGFEGNDTIASGDDVFLLQKAISCDKNAVAFLKNNEATVVTQTEATWSKLFQQRVRWASKTANYKGFYSKQLALFVFATNALLLLLLLSGSFSIFLKLFALKFLTDYLLFRSTAFYFKKPLRLLFLSGLIYLFFSVSVAVYALFGTYEWKGRRFSK